MHGAAACLAAAARLRRAAAAAAAAAAARACCCGGVGAEPVRMVQAAAPEPEPRQQPPRCARECRHHECRQPGLAGVKPCVNVGASLYQSMSATN